MTVSARHLATAFLAALLAAPAALAERENIWPEGKMPDAQPHQVAKMTNEAGENRAPYIDWLPAPEKPNGCCMILISGGGYLNCCDVELVETWGKKFTAAGFQCVNFVYRTPRPQGLPFYQSAWEDGQRAVRVVRSQAAKRGFRPELVGTMSMSAGSHLATLLATSSLTPAYEKVDALDDLPCNVAWAITGSIAYALDDGLGTPNARGGEGAKLDPVFRFDAKTAPMCMFHGSDDPFSPLASTLVYRELRKRKVPAELHLFADRRHGFWGTDGKGDRAAAYDNWFDRSMEFLRQIGRFLGQPGPEEALMARYATDFHDPAKYAKENLWPEGKTPDLQGKQCVPYLEWYIPSNLTTKAIQILYSGGAYQFNDPYGFEVAPARRFLNEKGMAVVTMKYRTPRPAAPLPKHATAWQDLQRCIRIVRSEAAAKGLDPDRIGVMGSSAGGHLTLLGVTSSQTPAYEKVDAIDDIPCNVQWGVAIYPAYSLTDGVDRENATGGNDDSAELVPEFAFDSATCPTLFIHGDADGWAAMNSVKAWERMRRMGVTCDLRTLRERGHCFQTKAPPGTGSYTWLGRIWEFMNHKGINK